MSSRGYLILGANGQLGIALLSRYPDAIAVDREKLDITNWNELESYDWSGVSVILNAAAYTDVDGAEAPEGRIAAWRVNAVAPSYLAKIATRHDITLLHISSDYIFDGREKMHAEDEPFSPLGVYGQTKAAGDIAVATTPKHYILRTSWVIGDGRNFVRTMMGLAEKNISPKVVNDQIGRLTFTNTLVGAIDALLAKEAPAGTYNVSNRGDPASWADITRTIFSQLGREDLNVTGVTTANYYAGKSGIAPRPLLSELGLDKITDIGFEPNDWRVALAEYIKNQ